MTSEELNDANWGADSTFPEKALQTLTVTGFQMNAQKGSDVSIAPVSVNDATSYFACKLSPDPTGKDTGKYLIRGAPANVESEIKRRADSGEVSLKPCKQVCMWDGTCDTPDAH